MNRSLTHASTATAPLLCFPNNGDSKARCTNASFRCNYKCYCKENGPTNCKKTCTKKVKKWYGKPPICVLRCVFVVAIAHIHGICSTDPALKRRERRSGPPSFPLQRRPGAIAGTKSLRIAVSGSAARYATPCRVCPNPSDKAQPDIFQTTSTLLCSSCIPRNIRPVPRKRPGRRRPHRRQPNHQLLHPKVSFSVRSVSVTFLIFSSFVFFRAHYLRIEHELTNFVFVMCVSSLLSRRRYQGRRKSKYHRSRQRQQILQRRQWVHRQRVHRQQIRRRQIHRQQFHRQ